MPAPTIKIHDEWTINETRSIHLARTDHAGKPRTLHFAVSYVFKPPRKNAKPTHGVIETGTFEKEKEVLCAGPPGPGRYTLYVHLWYVRGKKTHPQSPRDMKTHQLRYKAVE
jgi:hypothetical protein